MKNVHSADGTTIVFDQFGQGPALIFVTDAIAIRHPEVVRKLALASTAFKRDGWYPEDLAAMAAMSAEAFAGTPIHDAYLQTSPVPEAWPTVVAKVR